MGDDVETSDAPAGASLVAITFDDELKAQEALIACMRLVKHGHLELDDAAIAIKQDSGKVRIVQTKDVSGAQGAVHGSWWGLIAGLFVGGPLVGAALGAAVGGIWGKLRDIGIDDAEMRQMGERLNPGDAALFLLATDGHRYHVIQEARRFDGQLLHSTCEPDFVARLQEALGQGVADQLA